MEYFIALVTCHVGESECGCTSVLLRALTVVDEDPLAIQLLHLSLCKARIPRHVTLMTSRDVFVYEIAPSCRRKICCDTSVIQGLSSGSPMPYPDRPNSSPAVVRSHSRADSYSRRDESQMNALSLLQHQFNIEDVKVKKFVKMSSHLKINCHC